MTVLENGSVDSSPPGDAERSWANPRHRWKPHWPVFPGSEVAGFDRIGPPRCSPAPGSFGAQAAHGWTGSSRFRWKQSRCNICWFGASFGIFRGAVGRPEGAGTDQPGAECNAAPGGGNWSPSPERATQTDASIVSPFQTLFVAMVGYPGATATTPTRVALPWADMSGFFRAEAPQAKKNVRILPRNRVVMAMAGPDRTPGRGTRKNAYHRRAGAVG
jgi:hypothetical protein